MLAKKTQIGRNAQVGVSSKMDPGRLIAKNKYFPMNCEVNCGCLLNITFSFVLFVHFQEKKVQKNLSPIKTVYTFFPYKNQKKFDEAQFSFFISFL